MGESTITPAQTDALAKLSEIPPAGSEERERLPDFDFCPDQSAAFVAESAAVELIERLRATNPHKRPAIAADLMAQAAEWIEARKQGQRDALEAGTPRAPTRDIGIVALVNGMNEPDPSGSYMRLVLTKHEVREERLISFGAADVLKAELTAALATGGARHG